MDTRFFPRLYEHNILSIPLIHFSIFNKDYFIFHQSQHKKLFELQNPRLCHQHCTRAGWTLHVLRHQICSAATLFHTRFHPDSLLHLPSQDPFTHSDWDILSSDQFGFCLKVFYLAPHSFLHDQELEVLLDLSCSNSRFCQCIHLGFHTKFDSVRFFQHFSSRISYCLSTSSYTSLNLINSAPSNAPLH